MAAAARHRAVDNAEQASDRKYMKFAKFSTD